MEERVAIVHRAQPVESKTMEKYLVKKQKKGWIDISECAIEKGMEKECY
jgi:hypothetical protein